MIYILGGVGKTGCSTLAMMLAENNQIPRVYGGAFMRREAMLAGFARPGYEIPADQAEWNLDKANVAGFRAMCETSDRDIDAEIEVYLLTEMSQAQRTGGDLVVESKTMSRLLHSDAVDGLLVQAQQDLSPEVPRVMVNDLLQGPVRSLVINRRLILNRGYIRLLLGLRLKSNICKYNPSCFILIIAYNLSKYKFFPVNL